MRANGATVRLLTRSISSPTKRRVIQDFLEGFADAKHVSYETLSLSAIHKAHKKTHGRPVLPRYLFDKAEVIVGFDADFLGTWISPVVFTAGWAKGRRADADSDTFSHHVQVESRFSVTGGKADRRVPITPGQLGAVMSRIASSLAQKAGVTFDATNPGSVGVDAHVLEDIATRLWRARGKSLVVCGSQDVDTQVVCNFINHTLGSYGATLDIAHPSAQDDTGDDGIQTLLNELAGGTVDALFIDNVNPVYDLPNGARFADAMSKVGLVVSFADRVSDVSKRAAYVCPDHHYLESWGDVFFSEGLVGFQQPVIRPLFDTRSILESLSKWTGTHKSDQALVRETWGNRVARNKSIHDGFAKVSQPRFTATPFQANAVKAIPADEETPDGKLALVLYPKVAMLDGRGASNPWLQEMPDPITKVVWDNYASVSEAAAKELGIETGDVLRIKLSEPDSEAKTIELPALVQPGQHDQVVAIALGYGHPESARFENVGPEWLENKPTLGDNGLVGTSAAPLLTYRAGTLRLSGAHVSVTRTNRKHSLATTQDYHNIEVPAALVVPGMNPRRPMVRETTLAAYKRDGKLPELGHAHHEDLGDLWPDDHKYEGHHWGMAIDLTSSPAAPRASSPAKLKTTYRLLGGTRFDANASCTGYGSIAITSKLAARPTSCISP